MAISRPYQGVSDTAWAQLTRTVISQFSVFPFLSLLGIAVGGTLSILLIPEAFQQPYALMASGLAISAGILAGLAASFARSPASLLRSESIMMVGLVYWITLDAIQGSYGLWSASSDAIERAFLGTALFAAMIWVGSWLRFWNDRRLPQVPFGDPRPGLITVAGLIAGACGIFQQIYACDFSPSCIINAFFIRSDQAPWRIIETDVFGLRTFLKYMGFAGFLTLPLAAVLMRVERRISWRVIMVGILGILVLLLTIQAGGRRYVGMVVGATGLIWVLLHPRVQLRHLFRLAVLALLLLFILEAMVSWRKIGIGAGILSGELPIGLGHGAISVDKNLHYMTAAMTVVPERRDYTGTEGILYIIGAPVPRTVWPDKPKSRGINLPALIGERKAPGFSWSCSAVCDLYIIGGNLAIALGGILFGVLARLVNGLLMQPPSVRSRVLYGFSVMALFIGLRNVRDLFAIGLVTMFFLLVFVATSRILIRVKLVRRDITHGPA